MEFHTPLHSFDFAVPLVIPVLNGDDVKNTEEMKDTDLASRCVFAITGRFSGSGVVIAKRNTPIIVEGCQIGSLGITAGHVLGTSLGFPMDVAMVGFNKKRSVNVQRCFMYTVKEYSDWNAQPLLDPVNSIAYALPNDLGLVAIDYSANPFNDVMELSTTLGDETVFVSGYPMRPTEVLYCSPFLKKDLPIIAEKKLHKAFCNFDGRVISSGSALCLNQDERALLAVDYSATSAMSGGPVYVVRNGIPYLIGINLGGCCITGQNEVAKTLNSLLLGDWPTAVSVFTRAKLFVQSCGQYDSVKLEKKFQEIEDYLTNRFFQECAIGIVQLLSLMAVHYNFPLELNHNVALPYWNSVFEEIKRISTKFNSLPDSTFSTFNDLYSFLSS